MPKIELHELTPAERHLVECARDGKRADLFSMYPDESARIIRSQVFRDLCLGRYDGYTIDPGGIILTGAIFSDTPILHCLDLAFGLVFNRCTFRHGIDLHSTSLRHLEMLGCEVDGTLEATSAVVAGSVQLASADNGREAIPFIARGPVNFSGTKVGGQFACKGTQFTSPGDYGFLAQGLRVGQDLLLRDGFSAAGGVTFAGASIEGNLICINATFTALGKRCLFAPGVRVAGGVSLGPGFEAHGPVQFNSAKVGGQFDCHGANFYATSERCLYAQHMEVGLDIFLLDGFEASGPVVLAGAKVGGQLDCHGGNFKNSGSKCLHAQGIEVGQDVFLRDSFSAAGTVRFASAKVGGTFDCEGGKFTCTDSSLSAQSIEVKGNVFLTSGFEAFGSVEVNSAKVNGQFACSGGKFQGIGETCLFAQSVEVGQTVFLSDGFEAGGVVDFAGAKIGEQFDCHGGKFNGTGERCLYAPRIEIGLDAYLSEGFEVAGPVDLEGARIGGNLVWDPEGRSDVLQCSVSLRNTRLGTLIVNPAALRTDEAKARFVLTGLTYNTLDSVLESSSKLLARWIELADGGEYLPQPYEQAAKMLRAQGHLDAARDIAIAKRRRQRAAYSGKVAWLRKAVEKVALDWTIAYGYQTWRVLIFAISLVLWAGWSFSRPDGGAFQPVAGNACVAQVGARYAFRPYTYALDVFLPVLDLQQERQWAPDSTRPKGDRRWIVVRWLSIAGWVLTTLLVAAFTGIIKKD